MTVIGIDLGTTNSLVAIMDADGPRTLPNEFGDHLTPSAVAVAEDGAVLVGRAARDRLVTAPDSGRAFFKRDMGTANAPYQFGGRAWSATECSAQVLRELKRIAETHLGSRVERAVISVPAYFHDAQRQATIAAATIAGLKVERIINEPTAAALAFGYKHRERECTLLVFDLGGGTFDVTVLQVFEGVIEVKASGGESRLGGEDFTDALLDHVATAGRIPANDALARARLRQVVEVAKRKLATEDSATVAVGAGPEAATLTVTRADFARITQPLVARLRPVVRRCLRDARLEPSDLDEVLMVGGASRMPMVGEYITADLAAFGNRSLDPDRVVALGAAVQAALCERKEAVEDLVLTDVCPHTLGVMVAKEFAGQQKTGYFSPIIDRNTTVPVSRVERYNTFDPRQDKVEVKIFQGESRLTAENTLLGTLAVNGLRHKPGQEHPGEIDVRFSYDMNGILEVEVTVLATGLKTSRVIESRPGALSAAEIEAAIRRLAPLKTRPRDLLPNRARIERAQRLYPELSGAARAALEARLDDFETALETQDPKQIAERGAVLDSFLKHFYAEEGERQPGPPGDGGGAPEPGGA
jgi:molecular chaperone HscC